MRSFVRPLLTTVIALGLGSSATIAQSAPGIPEMPANIEVPAGYVPFFKGQAAGTQNYICLLAGKGFAWKFVGPQATLFADAAPLQQQVTTHFLSGNPAESGIPRPTWQHSFDTSSVWGRAIASSTDPAYVANGAIPWLLLQVVGAQPGPGGGSALTPTAFIHRVNTIGGIAPATGCSTAADAGALALVPYTTDYYFYRAAQEQ
jgi:hypothetical protein